MQLCTQDCQEWAAWLALLGLLKALVVQGTQGSRLITEEKEEHDLVARLRMVLAPSGIPSASRLPHAFQQQMNSQGLRGARHTQTDQLAEQQQVLASMESERAAVCSANGLGGGRV